MTTLFKQVSDYCEANGKSMPVRRYMAAISEAVTEAIKSSGTHALVKKKVVREPMIVNHYPVKLIPIVNHVIEMFFTDRPSFTQSRLASANSTVKEFPFDVERHKSEAFELALLKCGFPVKQNDRFNSKTKVQYIIPVSTPGHLVKLGKEFQKQRWYQENRIAIDRWRRKVENRKSDKTDDPKN